MRKRWWASASAVVLGLTALLVPRTATPPGEGVACATGGAPVVSLETPPEPPGSPIADEGDEPARGFRAPSGEPSGLSCEAARGIVAQTRRHLAYEPTEPAPRALAEGTIDWLDPHGLWSAAPDSPVGDVLQRHARDLLRDLESPPHARGGGDCASAREAGAALAAWIASVRRDFDRARLDTHAGAIGDSASESVFESGTVTQRARALAVRLGERVGMMERTLGEAGHDYAAAARARFFPELDADGWARVVLAAAVRAYVPLVDPHGAWAPADEEASVYEVDLEASPPERLWERCARTAVGIRLDAGALLPLVDGDVVLALGGIVTAGLPLEQVEQLALAVADGKAPASAVVLRRGEATPRTLSLDVHLARASAPASRPPTLAVERVPYGAGEALVVSIPDVHDDLGDELSRTLLHERQKDGAHLVGVALDLRGNGGGSTDGAVAALGLFLPGAALFPMKRRDGTIETDRAPELPAIDRWAGPVASLVDGDTASAAEMMSGALTSYRRGPSVGGLTFGKGCAQEYLDDDASAGVLRLTTLLYALPDGAPVQRVGLVPTYRFPFSPLGTPTESRSGVRDREREALLAHAGPTWRGPDVRDAPSVRRAEVDGWLAPWPPHGGTVGPCHDPEVCRALRLLGAPPGMRRVSRDRATPQPR